MDMSVAQRKMIVKKLIDNMVNSLENDREYLRNVVSFGFKGIKGMSDRQLLREFREQFPDEDTGEYREHRR